MSAPSRATDSSLTSHKGLNTQFVGSSSTPSHNPSDLNTNGTRWSASATSTPNGVTSMYAYCGSTLARGSQQTVHTLTQPPIQRHSTRYGVVPFTTFKELQHAATDFIYATVHPDGGGYQPINFKTLVARIKATPVDNPHSKGILLEAVMSASMIPVKDRTAFTLVTDLITAQFKLQKLQQEYTTASTAYRQRPPQGTYEQLLKKWQDFIDQYKALLHKTLEAKKGIVSGSRCMVKTTERLIDISDFSDIQKALLKGVLEHQFTEYKDDAINDHRLGLILKDILDNPPKITISCSKIWLIEQNKKFDKALEEQKKQKYESAESKIQQQIDKLEPIPSHALLLRNKDKASVGAGGENGAQQMLLKRPKPTKPTAASYTTFAETPALVSGTEITDESLERRYLQLKNDHSSSPQLTTTPSHPKSTAHPQFVSQPSTTKKCWTEAELKKELDEFLNSECSLTPSSGAAVTKPLVVKINSKDDDIVKGLKIRLAELQLNDQGDRHIRYVNEHNEEIPPQVTASLIQGYIDDMTDDTDLFEQSLTQSFVTKSLVQSLLLRQLQAGHLKLPELDNIDEEQETQSRSYSSTTAQSKDDDFMIFSIPPSNLTSLQNPMISLKMANQANPECSLACFENSLKVRVTEEEEREALDELSEALSKQLPPKDVEQSNTPKSPELDLVQQQEIKTNLLPQPPVVSDEGDDESDDEDKVLITVIPNKLYITENRLPTAQPSVETPNE